MIVARASLVTAWQRAMTVSVETSAPAATSRSSPPESKTHTSRSCAALICASATVFAWSWVSTKAATAPESARIHWTCSAEDVS
jgi:hypothetical protein